MANDRPIDVCKHCQKTLDEHDRKDIILNCFYEPMDNFELIEFYENRDTLRDWYRQAST